MFTLFWNPHTRLKPFPQKILSLETTIVDETEEHIQAGFCMDESSSFIYFELDKVMAIFHLQLTFHLECSSQCFSTKSYDQVSMLLI